MHKFNHDFSCILAIFAVSLFTREWIEMEVEIDTADSENVSLFTREWIEIKQRICFGVASPRLPLYEGVD